MLPIPTTSFLSTVQRDASRSEHLLMSVDVRPSNFDLFRECLSGRLVQRSTLDNAQTTRRRKSKGRKKEIKPVEDGLDKTAPQAEELSEFIDVRSCA